MNNLVRMGIVGIIYFMLVLSISSVMGYTDAATGKRGVSGDIQKVFLTSPLPLDFLKELEKSCNTSGVCVYGPFGFLAENEVSYYLVKWNDSALGEIKFSRNPGIYIVPRSDQSGSYFIIPKFSISSPADLGIYTPTPLEIIAPTLTVTSTYTPFVTPVVALTPTPSLITTITPKP